MTSRVQQNRTPTPNTPPANGALLPGALYVEMADPMRLWTGVPTSLDATGRRLVYDAAVQGAANTAAVQKAGDTMTGLLTLSGNPASPMHAATKAYADTKTTSVAGKTGVVTLVHTDITDWNATLAPYALLASPPLTGTPTAPTVTPTTDSTTKLATTAFVQNVIAAMPPPGATMLPGTPGSSQPGQLWFDTTGGQLYVRYDDGNSQQWIIANSTQGLADAATKTDVAAAQNNIGRNLLHNPLFNVAQRGAGPWTTQLAYTMDRWVLSLASDTATVSQNPQGDSDRTQIGDETSRFCLRNQFVGNAGAGAVNYVTQWLEDVRRLGGKTVTVSFWATSNGTPKLGVSLDQWFGTPGGGGSAQVNGTGQSVTLSTTWTRYSLTFSVPSTSSKTLSSSASDATGLNFWFSSGATYAARTGNVGVQTAIVFLWGVQLEVGSVMTPLEKPDPGDDLRRCQRFYLTTQFGLGGYTGASIGLLVDLPFIMQMRATPTLTPSSVTQTNCSGGVITPLGGGGYQVYTVGTAAGGYVYSGNLSASADL